MHLRNLLLRFQIKRLVQPPHHQQQDQRERQRGQDHRRLQRIDTAGKQQRAGHQCGHRAPENPQPFRPVFIRIAALGGQRRQHHGAGVGGGDEEHEADEHRDRNDGFAPRVGFQQQVERHRRIVDGRHAERAHAVVEHLIDGAVAEDRHPRQGEAERNQQHAEDELADGATTGNPSNEQTHER
ncbi:hypothetical protein D9M71_365120 [compost metagenome]